MSRTDAVALDPSAPTGHLPGFATIGFTHLRQAPRTENRGPIMFLPARQRGWAFWPRSGQKRAGGPKGRMGVISARQRRHDPLPALRATFPRRRGKA